MTRRTALFALAITTASLLGVGSARAVADVAGCDFNGDGNADIATGMPNEDLGGVRKTGAVHVIYGSDGGVTTEGDEFIHQNKRGIPGSNEAYDHFGFALACGDFNDDGDDELVVGTPLEDLDLLESGSITVIPGSGGGLKLRAARRITQATDGLATGPDDYEEFGRAVAVGDFDGDGTDDLAVGVPGDDIHDLEGERRAGAVHVLFGTGRGLTGAGSDYLHQNVKGMQGMAESEDGFGASLAGGDFDGDGRDDLAVGVLYESVDDSGADAHGGGGRGDGDGAIHVIRGSAHGMTLSGQQFLNENSGSVAGQAQSGDQFGWDLAAGNFNGDGRDDLAVGVPRDNQGTGAVHVLTGSPDGLSTTVTIRVTSIERRFGYSLATGDFDCDGSADLAVGSQHGNSVTVLAGGPSGVDPTGAAVWTQGTPGIDGSAELNDFFGHGLTSGDLDGDGRGDLVVGAPGEDLRGVSNAGAVNVIFGSATGLTAQGDRLLHQDTKGLKNAAESGDQFGRQLP